MWLHSLDSRTLRASGSPTRARRSGSGIFGDAPSATCLIPVSRPHDYATAGRIGLLDEGVDQDFQIGDQSTFSYSMGSINTIV